MVYDNLIILSGRQIDGVWHTGVVAYGREYFFGGGGIQSCLPVSILHVMQKYPQMRSTAAVACHHQLDINTLE